MKDGRAQEYETEAANEELARRGLTAILGISEHHEILSDDEVKNICSSLSPRLSSDSEAAPVYRIISHLSQAAREGTKEQEINLILQLTSILRGEAIDVTRDESAEV